MKKIINTIKSLIASGLLTALIFSVSLLQGQNNNALHFDGVNDCINLYPISCMPASDADFTVEMWFKMQEFRSCEGWDVPAGLFAFHDGPSGFFTGERNGHLQIVYQCYLSTGIGGPVFRVVSKTFSNMLEIDKWYALSVVRENDDLRVFLDCNIIFDSSNFFVYENTTFNPAGFEVGKSTPGGLFMDDPCYYWHGEVDEVRLWKKALSSGEIQQMSCKPCAPDQLYYFNENDLLVRWSFDDAIPGGNNTGKVQVMDYSGNTCDNPGTLHSFALTGLTSNFINSAVFLDSYFNHYILLKDAMNLNEDYEICCGDVVHFSIVDGNLQAPAFSNTNVVLAWEYQNSGSMDWISIAPDQAMFNGFYFAAIDHDAIKCPANYQDSEINRFFRARIIVGEEPNVCEYLAEHYYSWIPLKICCEIENPSLNITKTGNLCEFENISFNLNLNTGFTNLPGPPYSLSVHWKINGISQSQYDNQTSIVFSVENAVEGDICFEATISNGPCNSKTLTKCYSVDPRPVCGNIAPGSLNLFPKPGSNDHFYIICPGDDAKVKMVSAASFIDSKSVWQFSLPHVPGNWNDLGTGNYSQNTNVLPQLPPPSASPYLWDPGVDDRIYYRVECRPEKPGSECPADYSNVLTIELPPMPTKPIIYANDPIPVCAGESIELYYTPNQEGVVYAWYFNGLPAGSGALPFTASQQGYYVVKAKDRYGCYEISSDPFFLQVCDVVASISCPIPDCPCIGDEITLSALGSSSTCTGTLTFSWKINGVEVSTDSSLNHIPDPTGTTYSLTVTDANSCIGTTERTVVPCDCSE